MIIGDKFAYGHIPKTGGDAVRAWFRQLANVHVDSARDPRKHDFFWRRDLSKDVYALSIRRLPSWALSYLHELMIHPAAAREYGLPPGETVRPEHAFALRADQYLLRHQMFGHKVEEWLRMEYLFADVIRFIDRYVEPVTLLLRFRLSNVWTKAARHYDHRVDSFFTSAQIADLYARNPAWTEVEQAVYGSLYAHGDSYGATINSGRIAA